MNNVAAVPTSSEMRNITKRTKFLCSQVTAPIKNEEGEISMFIMNFEDITDAPYRDEVITPCTSPLMFFKRFPQISRQIQRMRPRLHNSIRSVEDYTNNEAGPRGVSRSLMHFYSLHATTLLTRLE
ncbi:potassium voltage-gated channel subfamily H member 7 [Trichonephila clavipes]|nr:potassium voltage-gated channel subfamily H member 7 [Trichonephila clavipes]